MRKIIKSIICVLISALLIFSPFADAVTKAEAASVKRYKLSAVEPSQFTNNPVLLSNLEKIFSEYPTAFTTTGTACPESHDYCKSFTSHQSHAHSGKGVQCFGYANYVYETLFGTYWDFEEYIYSDGTLGSTKSAAKVKSEFLRTGACFGTIIRSYEPHSMIVLSTDDDGVWILHANYGGSTYGWCTTAVHYYPWADFASSHGQLKYIIVPESLCEECVYTKESYPYCSVCDHRFNEFDDVYVTYSANENAMTYTLPITGCENTALTAGTEITITEEFTINGEEWLISEDGSYYRKSEMTFVRYCESLNASSLVCPEYIIEGDSFWLQGTVKSKNIISSLTVAIHNPDGTIVESNTIHPNAYSVSVKNADTLLFSELPTGEYIYRLSATDAAETKVLYDGAFSVITSTTMEQAYPDEVFRNYIINNILADESVTASDYADKYDNIISQIAELDISALGIKSADGIERFTALKSLDCSGNSLTEINLTSLSQLENVILSDQYHSTDAVYDEVTNTFTAQYGNVFSKTYTRPLNLPAIEYVYYDTGIEGIVMRLAITVDADFSRFANLNPEEDSLVNSTDLSMLLSAYGRSSEGNENTDVNFDGIINSADLSILLSEYGSSVE